MRAPLAVALAVAAASVALPASARAEGITVLGVEAIDAPEATANALTDALRARARETNVKLVPAKDFMEVKMLYSCMEPAQMATCLAQAARAVGADEFIYGTIAPVKGGGRHHHKDNRLQVSIKLVDAKTGQVQKFVDAQATPGEIPSQAGQWFSQLVPPRAAPATVTPPPVVVVPPAPRAPPQLAVKSEPAGASVNLDGKDVGTTPIKVAVAPGEHRLVVAKEGYASETKSVSVTPSGSETVEVTLQANPVVVPTQPVGPVANEHPGRNLKIAGVAVFVAGLAAIGVEIYTWRTYTDLESTAESRLQGLHNRGLGHDDWFQKPDCNPPFADPGGTDYSTYVTACNRGHNYANASTALLISGITLGVVGAGLFGAGVYKANKADKPQAFAPRLRLLSPVVTREGGGVSAAFEF